MTLMRHASLVPAQPLGLAIREDDLLRWLRTDAPDELERLWEAADARRRQYVGDAVHLRGLVEFSNHCRRRRVYCGIRAENHQVQRYRLSFDEILSCARQAVAFGDGTVVLQSGEDLFFGPESALPGRAHHVARTPSGFRRRQPTEG